MAKPGEENEAAAYAEHLNNMLHKPEGDKDIAHLMPLVGADLFDKVYDGILLSKVVNVLKPNTINTSKLTYNINRDDLRNGKAPGSKAIFEATANQNAFIEGANKVGIKIVNIGAQDLIDGNHDLVLGIVWQIVRAHLLRNVDILSHPELIRLMERHENLRTLIDLGPETLLIRWFNYHLRRANATRKVGNFTESIKDSENYLRLMQQIAPKLVDSAKLEAALATTDLEARARIVLEIAETLDCRQFVTVKDIVNGNARLNLAFTATLFNTHLGIRLPSEDEIAAMYDRFDKMALQISHLEQALAAKEASAREEGEKNINVVSELHKTVAELSKAHEATQEKLSTTEDELSVVRQQSVLDREQIERMEQELRATTLDMAKSADEKLVSLQERYDKQMAEMSKQMTALQEEKITLTSERDRLVKDKETLEAKANKNKQMSDLMTQKVYEIAEELAHAKRSHASADPKKK